jgi:hypothetical protein
MITPQTPEERRQEQIDALDATNTHPTLPPRCIAEECLDNLLAYLDEHQPLTAKLLREGDPEGPVADAIRYGFVPDHPDHPDPRICINYPEETDTPTAEDIIRACLQDEGAEASHIAEVLREAGKLVSG